MTGDNAQYLQMFLDESMENTQLLNTICLKLEQGGTDEIFATMFRAAHTLKGMSATMGFTKMAVLTHRLEDALGIIRENPSLMSPDLIDAFFGAIDALESMLGEIQATGTEGDQNYDELIDRFNRVSHPAAPGEVAATSVAMDAPRVDAGASRSRIEMTEHITNATLRASAGGNVVGYLQVGIDEACVMKGPRAIMVVKAIDLFADIIACHPATEDIESGSFDSDIEFLLVLRGDTEQALIHSVNNVSEVTRVNWNLFAEQKDSTPVSLSASTEVAATSQRAERTEKKAAVPAKSSDRTVRVPVERLDLLMNLLSELVIDRTRLASIAGEVGRADLKDVTDKMSRVSNDLQASVMSLRMVPVESLFQRFPRMVRDLSKTLHKDIRLEMTGMETEFDRTVIDEMGEALVHLIRNASDHGLESTEDRVKAGKPSHGTIQLHAYASGQHVFIEVQDDGGGIHTEKVRDRAVSRGIISASQAESMTEQQIHGLLFESGFSTADTVSDVSGRGVGLDAVKQKVESLGGRIHIESARGLGSTFRIQLPLTLSILSALMVKISSDTYAIPLGNVEEVVLAGPSDVKKVHGRRVLYYRDRVVPILDAGSWLHGESTVNNGQMNIVICKTGSQRIAISVHSLIGQQEIVNKSLGAYLRKIDRFSGATILGNGEIALIADVNTWVTAAS